MQNSPAGGIVVCQVESQDVSDGTLRLIMKIRDTGPGIDVNQRKELQRPFCCGVSGNNRHAWGVGLSLSRLIASRLNGFMKIGGVDQGCQVTLEIDVQSGCAQT